MSGFLLIIICIFLWSGFIGAISFMESWLKFRAPGLTIPVGLNIGKLVFSALNKVEWAFAMLITIFILLNSSKINSSDEIWFLVIVVILITQTTWLLPALDKRAKAIIGGATLPPSTLHWYFVIAELIKLLLLIVFGISLLNSLLH